MIERLSDMANQDANEFGNKSITLSKLLKNNFNVPDGFVISSSVFNQLIKNSSYSEKIYAQLNSATDIQSLTDSFSKISSLITDIEFPKSISKRISQHVSDLNYGQLAVRSSCPYEDSASASWAGVFESFMPISPNKIIASIKECWKSCFSPSSILYHKNFNYDITKASMAVIIQRFFKADFAGVAFSKNPINNDESTIIVESHPGAGELLVSGKITPTTYLVNKNNNQIKQSNSTPSDICFLEHDKILAIAHVTKQIQTLFSYHCDVEWIYVNNTLYVIQARPIST